MFRATVRSFVEKEVMPHVEAWETAGRMPKAIFRRMGELGFLGLEYDERYGGAGADVMMTAVLHEECARSRSGSFAMAVGVHCDMASPHLYWTGSEALKETYLPAICRGEKLTAIAVTEPGGGSDVAALRTRAVRDGNHYVINGTKMFITKRAMAGRAAGRCRTSGPSATSSRRWRPTSRRGAGSPTPRGRSTRRGRTPCARSRWSSSSPPRWSTASPTAACSCTAATATCASTRWSGSRATHG